MDILIKNATQDDLKTIQELNLKLFEKEHKEYDSSLNLDWTFGQSGTKYFKDRIYEEDGFLLIAIVEDETVGYLCGGLAKADSSRTVPVIAEIENTFVLDKFRSNGIGKQLYDEFVKWCRIKNADKVKVGAYTKNRLAIKFYRNNNFKDATLGLEADL